MSNSPLISGTLLTNNCYKPRAYKITRITPHYMAWYTDAKTCCESFVPAARRASANYCIGKDGEIWLNVDEKNGAWTSGNYDNDNRAITIECANYNNSGNGHVYGELPTATWNSLVRLCADICKRNGIAKCTYTGNVNGVLTKHKWFQNTDCPGPWLDKQFDRLATEVNKLLNAETTEWSEDMTFLFTYDNKVWFYDAGKCVHISGEEQDAIQAAYSKATGEKIPFFDFPKGNHLISACKRM